MNSQLVYILDDNQEFRESTAFLLEAMDYQVEHFGDHEEILLAMTTDSRVKAVCLLLDIRMPVVSGFDVHDLMNERKIDIPVVYMTAHGDVPLAVSAMRKGALTFLEKPLDDDELVAALDLAFSAVVQVRRSSAVEQETILMTRKMMETLTPRELDVARLIVNEMSNKEIGDQLGISVKTVEVHRSRAMHKLKARNTAQFVRKVMVCEEGPLV